MIPPDPGPKQSHVLIASDAGEDIEAILSKASFECRRICLECALKFTCTERWRADLRIVDLGPSRPTTVQPLQHLLTGSTSIPSLVIQDAPRSDDCVGVLEMGADDYMARPLNSTELLARARAVMRRSQRTLFLALGDLRLDLARRRAKIGPKHLELSPKEFDLLELLVEHQGAVVSREVLYGEIWDLGAAPETPMLEVLVSRLRGRLRGSPWVVERVGHEGYQLVDQSLGQEQR